MKFLGPIIVIIIAGGIFFYLTDPILNTALTVDPQTNNVSGGVFPLLSERNDLNTALSNSQKLQDASRALVDQYNSLAPADIAAVDTLLPDHIDNVQLVIDINSIADQYGMTIKNIKITTQDQVSPTGRPVIKTSTTGEQAALISFNVTGSYNQLRNFLTDLARSLRLVDVTGLSFVASDQDLYQFNVELKTYWLE